MNRVLRYILGLFSIILLISLSLNSCRSPKESILKGDVIGFSDDVQTSYKYQKKMFKKRPYDLLTSEGQNKMDDYIRNIPSGQNTVGYFALDLALDRVKWVRKKVFRKDPEAKYYIVLLTDGLDNGSTVAAANNHRGKYKDINKYIKKLDKQKTKVMGHKKKQDYFQIYPCVFTKGDLDSTQVINNMSDQQFDAFVENIMKGYRGASKGTDVPPVLHASELDSLFLAFTDRFRVQSFDFVVPKGYLNKRVRMKFEDVNGDQVSVEGTFAKKGKKYIMKDIVYSKGLSSEKVPNGGKIEEINHKKKDLLASFRIDNLQYKGKVFKINPDPKKIIQEVQDYGYYTTNSEYISQANQRKKAYVLMVVDGSKSFGKNLLDAKETAIKMREVVTK